MKIDMSGDRHEPKFLERSRVLKQHPRIGWSRISVFFAANDEHGALDVGNVIDRTQLRSRNAKPPLQLVQQNRRQNSPESAEVIFHPDARCDFDCWLDLLKHKRIDFQGWSREQSSYAA